MSTEIKKTKNARRIPIRDPKNKKIIMINRRLRHLIHDLGNKINFREVPHPNGVVYSVFGLVTADGEDNKNNDDAIDTKLVSAAAAARRLMTELNNMVSWLHWPQSYPEYDAEMSK